MSQWAWFDDINIPGRITRWYAQSNLGGARTLPNGTGIGDIYVIGPRVAQLGEGKFRAYIQPQYGFPSKCAGPVNMSVETLNVNTLEEAQRIAEELYAMLQRLEKAES